MKIVVSIMIILCCVFLLASNSKAVIMGMPLPDRCPSGSIEVANYNTVCKPNTQNSYFGGATTWSGNNDSQATMYDGFDSYVPFTGKWRMVTHFCPGKAICNLQNAISHYVSSKEVELNTSKGISSQSPNFGGGAGPSQSQAGTVCFTFQDVQGKQWGTSADRTCQDATPLPEEPSICYINYNNSDLNVSMGDVERTDITSNPMLGAVGNIKKQLIILCNGEEASVTSSTQFKFTPLSVGGNQVIQSSRSGLGIALFYNGKAASTKDIINETFMTGNNERNIEFQIVRDPNMKPEDIPADAFTANAVMILTIE